MRYEPVGAPGTLHGPPQTSRILESLATSGKEQGPFRYLEEIVTALHALSSTLKPTHVRVRNSRTLRDAAVRPSA